MASDTARISRITACTIVDVYLFFKLQLHRRCTRQLRRLRKKLTTPHSDSKLMTLGSPGPKRDSYHLLIQAFLAERARAHAMESKQYLSGNIKMNVATEQTRKKYAERHLCQRLVKAAAHSNTLRALCITMGDYALARECNAYADWIDGLTLESKGDYNHAATAFERACDIYNIFAKCHGDTACLDPFQNQAIDCSKATRRCNLAGGSTHSLEISNMDKQDSCKVVNLTCGLESSGSIVVNWCGSSPEITAEEVKRRLRVCGPLKYPRIFDVPSGGTAGLCCQNIRQPAISLSSLPNEVQYAQKMIHLEDIIRAAISEQDAKTQGDFSLELLVARTTYEKLDLLYQRCDAAVIERASEWRWVTLGAIIAQVCNASLDSVINPRIPDDVIHLYDKMIEVTKEMAALTVLRDAKDETLAERLHGRNAALRAYRCYFLAETFCVHMDESHTASALLRHTIYLADHASQEAEACEVPVLSIETAHLSDAAQASLSRVKAARCLDHLHRKYARESTFSQSTLTMFLGVLDIHVSDLLAISSASCFQASGVPCKPILFNLGHVYLNLPSFQTKTNEKGVSGLFGWFRS